MPYQFSSRATGNLLMLNADAEKLLSIIGKPATREGIITVAQIPAAIQALRQAIAESEALMARTQPQGDVDDADEKDGDEKEPEPVSVRQRFYPFVEMLQRCLEKNCDVMWGV